MRGDATRWGRAYAPRRLARHVQAEVFEEIATMEFPFEGIPTVPPRKDMEHFAFFCDGCRYRCGAPCASRANRAGFSRAAAA